MAKANSKTCPVEVAKSLLVRLDSSVPSNDVAQCKMEAWRLLNSVIELRRQREELEADIAGRLEAEMMANAAKYLFAANPACDAYSMPRVPSEVSVIPRARSASGGLVKFAPLASGVYFLWNKGKVVYVGGSVNLNARLTSAHNQLRDDDYVSWLIRPTATFQLDECFYIWLLKPQRNGQVREPARYLQFDRRRLALETKLIDGVYAKTSQIQEPIGKSYLDKSESAV